jgi:hypothetical protein
MEKTEIMKALASVAKDVGKPNGAQRSAFAQVILESIEPNHLSFDILSSFMPTRSLNPGDQLARRVRKGIPVRTFVPGTTHLADQIAVRDVMVHAIDYIVAKVRYSLWELQRAELGTMETFRSDMQSAMIDEIVNRAFSLLSTVWTQFNGGSNYTNAVSTGLTQDNLAAAMEVVLRRAGQVKAIVGTRVALLPLYNTLGVVVTPVAGSTSVTTGLLDILSEWQRTGRVITFRGAPLVELPQIYKRDLDGFDTPLLPEDKVIVVGDNAGEFILYGGIESQEHTDTSIEPPDYSLAMWRGFGMIVDRPENIAILKVS